MESPQPAQAEEESEEGMTCGYCNGPIRTDQRYTGVLNHGNPKDCIAFAVQQERERCLAWVGAFAKDCGCSDEIKKKIERVE